MEEEFSDGKDRFEEDIANIVDSVVDSLLRTARTAPDAEELPTGFRGKVVQEYGAEIKSLKDEVFGKWPLKQGTSRKLTSLVVEFLLRPTDLPSSTGIVIAGFGREECFPRLVEIRIAGVVGGRPIYRKTREVVIGPEEVNAAVLPFAQQEMVATFMDGIDPYLRQVVDASVQEVFEEISKTLVKEVGKVDEELSDALSERLYGVVGEAVEGLSSRWERIIRDRYSRPVLEIVGSLPKDELAAIAESLVNLTKFKRRVSREQETVGGPIDVAVITKGDGFVWLRRKHYFKPELNPRIIARYYRREEGADGEAY